MPFDLVGAVEQELQKRDARKLQKESRDSHHPSSASAALRCQLLCPDRGTDACMDCKDKSDNLLVGPCMRQQWWKWLREPVTNPLKLNSYFKFRVGTASHEIWQDWIGMVLPATAEDELWLHGYTKYPIHGYGDGTYPDYDPEREGRKLLTTVYEIKSTADRRVKDIKRVGIRPSWWLQYCLYLVMARKQYPWFEAEWAKFLVGTSGSGYWTQFDKKIEWSEVHEVFDAIVKRWVEFEGYLERKELPPAEYAAKCEFKRYPCSWCGYLSKCKELEP